MTIIGDGFTNNTVVVINGTTYTNGTNGCIITYDRINITTLPCTEGSSVITVYVNGTKPLQNTTFTFDCSSTYTPVINTIYPANVTGTGTITLTGNNFGKPI